MCNIELSTVYASPVSLLVSQHCVYSTHNYGVSVVRVFCLFELLLFMFMLYCSLVYPLRFYLWGYISGCKLINHDHSHSLHTGMQLQGACFAMFQI